MTGGQVAIALPLIAPLAFAAVGLAFAGRARIQRWLALAGALAHVTASLWLCWLVFEGGAIRAQVGGWAAPYGIGLVADRASAMMLALAGAVTLATTVFAFGSGGGASWRRDYYPLFSMLLLGASGAALSADLFNLYVWFEVMLASSFALLAFCGRAPQLKASLVYVSLNLLASAFYLFAVAVFYRGYGALDLGTLAEATGEGRFARMHGLAWGFLFVFFLVKMAAFPFFAWLPTTYPRPPIAVAALFSGILTKMAFFVLLKLWSALSPPEIFSDLAFWLGVLTLLSGLSAAIAEREARRLATWLLAGEMGYLLLALSFWDADGVAAALFLLIHMALAINALLLVIGALEGHWATIDTRSSYGILMTRPWLAGSLGVAGLALAGVPPLSGFAGKLGLLQAAFARGSWVGAGATLLASFLSIVALGALWASVCWGEGPAELEPERSRNRWGGGPALGVGLLVASLLGMTVGAGWLYSLCQDAAVELLGAARGGGTG